MKGSKSLRIHFMLWHEAENDEPSSGHSLPGYLSNVVVALSSQDMERLLRRYGLVLCRGSLLYLSKLLSVVDT